MYLHSYRFLVVLIIETLLRTFLTVTKLLATVAIEQTINVGCNFYLRFHHYEVFIAILCYIRIQRKKRKTMVTFRKYPVKEFL